MFLEKLEKLVEIISRINMPIAFLGKVEQPTHNYYNCVFYGQPPYDTIENRTTGTAAPRTGRPAESGEFPVGPGDCPAPGDEKSATPNQGT